MIRSLDLLLKISVKRALSRPLIEVDLIIAF